SQNTHQMNAFDSYLEKDSMYRYNTSLRMLDSLISSSIVKSVRDTSFYNSYGKADGITLSQLIYSAISNNPQLKTMEYKIDAEKVRADGFYLPDPVFEYEMDDLQTDLKRVGMINFYLSQSFPFPGKLSLQRKSALNSSEVINMEHHNMEVNIINSVKKNFYDIYFINQKLQLNQENQLVV